jgi:hypothetical protein
MSQVLCFSHTGSVTFTVGVQAVKVISFWTEYFRGWTKCHNKNIRCCGDLAPRLTDFCSWYQLDSVFRDVIDNVYFSSSAHHYGETRALPLDAENSAPPRAFPSYGSRMFVSMNSDISFVTKDRNCELWACMISEPDCSHLRTQNLHDNKEINNTTVWEFCSWGFYLAKLAGKWGTSHYVNEVLNYRPWCECEIKY